MIRRWLAAWLDRRYDALLLRVATNAGICTSDADRYDGGTIGA